MRKIVPQSLILAACALAAQTGYAYGDVDVRDVMVKNLADIPGKQVQMLTVTYAPGAGDPVHRHDAHGFIYVLEGSVVMQVRGGKEVLVKQGQTFYEAPDDVHVVGRNASRSKPAKFVVFLVKDKDKPAVIPAD